MRYFGVLLVVLVVGFCSNFPVNAQHPASAVRHYQNGVKQIEKGDLAAAAESFTKAIEISSRLAPTKGSRDWQNGNNFADVTHEALQINVIDPLTAYAYNNRAVVHYRQGDFDATIADCDSALKIHPGLAAAYMNRGTARRAKGDLSGALSDFDRALAIDSTLIEAYNNRGTLRQDLGDLNGGLDDLDRAIAINPR